MIPMGYKGPFNSSTFLVGTIWAHYYWLVENNPSAPFIFIPVGAKVCPEPDLLNANFKLIPI